MAPFAGTNYSKLPKKQGTSGGTLRVPSEILAPSSGFGYRDCKFQSRQVSQYNLTYSPFASCSPSL